MQFRYREPSKGHWVVHNTGWTFNTPRSLKRHAATLLHKWSKVPMSACYTAVEIAIGSCYEEWQLAVMDYYGPRPINDGEFIGGRSCDLCGRAWYQDGTKEIYVRTDHSAGFNNRRQVCQECWEKEGLEEKQPDLTWHEGACSKCGAASGDHKTWVVSNLFGDKDVCHNCCEEMDWWKICPKCNSGKNTARPIVGEDLVLTHKCQVCGIHC
jgi:hypothetical protein